jgi:hypothetical protein
MKTKPIFITVLFLIFISCSESKYEPVHTDSLPPQPLTVTEVEEAPGGAKIFFNVLNETDISYIYGEFVSNGELRIVRSSIYNNFLTVEGLGNTDPVEITLFVVDHSENRSTPVTLLFTPLEPPVRAILKTMSFMEDFGGVTVQWENPSQTEICFNFMASDSVGVLQDFEIVFNKQSTGTFSMRGFDTQERLFGVHLRDKWGNKSDTFSIARKPLYEENLNRFAKEKYYEVALPGDNTSHTNSRPLSNVWDGNLAVIWHTNPGAFGPPPQYFTICLGDDVEAKLSRIHLWHRTDGYTFGQHNPRYFEVWGTTQITHDRSDVDYWWNTDSWKADWQLIGDYECAKPSGLPLGENNADDNAARLNGFDFPVSIEKDKVRFVRFVVKQTWASTNAMHIAEIIFYGDDYIDN